MEDLHTAKNGGLMISKVGAYNTASHAGCASIRVQT